MEPISLTIRLPEELHSQLTARAKQEDRTLASLIRVLLAQAVRSDPQLSDWGGRAGVMPQRMAGETDEAWKARVMEAGQR